MWSLCHVPRRDGSPARIGTAGTGGAGAFTIAIRGTRALRTGGTVLASVRAMYPLPFLADGRPHADADRLLAAHGPDAALAAAVRADQSRTIGNHLRFCHWREVERLIGVLAISEAGTIH